MDDSRRIADSIVGRAINTVVKEPFMLNLADDDLRGWCAMLVNEIAAALDHAPASAAGCGCRAKLLALAGSIDDVGNFEAMELVQNLLELADMLPAPAHDGEAVALIRRLVDGATVEWLVVTETRQVLDDARAFLAKIDGGK